MPPATLKVTQQITDVFGAPIKQYPGQSQVTRGVRVKVPGTHTSHGEITVTFV